MARAACVPVVVSGWQCKCRRCAYEWFVLCGCAEVETDTKAMVEVAHKCVRPVRCKNSKCKSRTWQTDIPRASGRPFGTKYNHKPFVYRTGSRAWKVKVRDFERDVWVESYETYATKAEAEAALPVESNDPS